MNLYRFSFIFLYFLPFLALADGYRCSIHARGAIVPVKLEKHYKVNFSDVALNTRNDKIVTSKVSSAIYAESVLSDVVKSLSDLSVISSKLDIFVPTNFPAASFSMDRKNSNEVNVVIYLAKQAGELLTNKIESNQTDSGIYFRTMFVFQWGQDYMTELTTYAYQESIGEYFPLISVVSCHYSK
jgi:hypothetical protein